MAMDLSTKLKGIVRTALENEKRQAAVDRALIAVREILAETKVSGFAQAYFDHIPAQKIVDVENTYPQLVQQLFELAQEIVAGKHGRALQEAAMAEESLPREKLKPLIKAHVSIGRGDMAVLMQIFRTFVSHFVNPSHLTVDLFLERFPDFDKAIALAFSMKNTTERARSFVHIVNKLTMEHQVEKALDVVEHIKSKSEKVKPLLSLIEKILTPLKDDVAKLIDQDHVDSTIMLAHSLREIAQRENIFHHIAIGLTKNDRIEKALELTGHIKDRSLRDFTLSAIVQVLASKHHFIPAKEIAFSIEDDGFQEDALGYIVKGLLEHSIDTAIAFVEAVPDFMRTRMAKILLSSAVAHHDEGKVREICRRFDLVH